MGGWVVGGRPASAFDERFSSRWWWWWWVGRLEPSVMRSKTLNLIAFNSCSILLLELFLSLSWFSHITPTLKSFLLLKIQEQIFYKKFCHVQICRLSASSLRPLLISVRTLVPWTQLPLDMSSLVTTPPLGHYYFSGHCSPTLNPGSQLSWSHSHTSLQMQLV